MLRTRIVSYVLIGIIFSAGAYPAIGQVQYDKDTYSASMWIPYEILPGQTYYGIIIIDDVVDDDDAEFNIITDNDEIVSIVTEKVSIPKEKHHGIITLETKGTGDAIIYAIYKDILLEQEIKVVESADTPTTLDLIIPSNSFNVLVDENISTGYVFLLNNFEKPLVANKPIQITLTSNGNVVLTEDFVVIEPGKHYTKFFYESDGDGSITATAPDLEPDTENANLSDTEKILLKLAVAPDPIPTSSTGEVYFWLERDGKPFLAPHDIEVTISIDKSANLSFDSAIEGAIVLAESTISSDGRDLPQDVKNIITRTSGELSRDAKDTFLLNKGEHYGRMTVYASFDSKDDIKISGLAESIRPGVDEEIIRQVETINVSTESSSSVDRTTKTKVFALPDPAYKKVDIIVSSFSDDGPVLEDDDERFVIFADNKLDIGSSAGKIFTDENYAITTVNTVDVGDSEIFAELDETESDETTIEIAEKFVKDPDIEITVLPIIFGIEQDLFLITSTQDVIKTDPNSTEEGNIISITSKPSFEYNAVREGESVITVKGKISEISEEDPRIHVASNAFTASESLEVYHPELKTIISMHPETVFPNEPFPIINHIANLDNHPLQKADLAISSDAELDVVDGLGQIDNPGKYEVIFYQKNTVPVESSIEVKGTFDSLQKKLLEENSAPVVFTYDVVVENGEGSGEYEEGSDVIISAPDVLDDKFLFKKKLVGWQNLPYTTSTATFEADDDIITNPIYEDDYTILLGTVGIGASGGGFVFLRKWKKKQSPEKEEEISDYDESEEDL